MTDVSLYVNRRGLSALVDREAKLRKEYIAAASGAEQAAPTSQSQIPVRSTRDILVDSAAFLELILVIQAWHEAAVELGLRTVGATIPHATRLIDLADTISGYSSQTVLQENAHRVEFLRGRVPDPDAVIDVEAFGRVCSANVASCPIDELEELACDLEEPELGHRCRKAHDALAAAARRSNLKTEHLGRVLGRAYAERRLSMDEVAEAMCVSAADAMFFLDEHGFARTVARGALSEEERSERFAAMRRDRLARQGRKPTAARELAERNVIASQRIEGVDARRWIPTRS